MRRLFLTIINAYVIQAELSGPCYHEKEEVLPAKKKGSLIRKFQKCGKKNCKCQHGELHGPYYWRVTYDKKTKKRIWKFVGKMIEK